MVIPHLIIKIGGSQFATKTTGRLPSTTKIMCRQKKFDQSNNPTNITNVKAWLLVTQSAKHG